MKYMDVHTWQERVRAFAQQRDWEQFHTPKNLAMALSVEASELLEVFQWLTAEQSALVMESEAAANVRDEVADVLLYLLRLADVLELDLDACLAHKFAENEQRYPAANVRGSAAKAGPATG